MKNKKIVRVYNKYFSSGSELRTWGSELEKLMNEEIEKGLIPIQVFTSQSSSASGSHMHIAIVLYEDDNNLNDILHGN